MKDHLGHFSEKRLFLFFGDWNRHRKLEALTSLVEGLV